MLVRPAGGMIKLYRNYAPATSDTPVQTVSAYHGLNGIFPLQRGSDVLVNWKRACGLLHISSDARIVLVWYPEMQLLDLYAPGEPDHYARIRERVERYGSRRFRRRRTQNTPPSW